MSDSQTEELPYPLDLDWVWSGTTILQTDGEGYVEFHQALVPGGTLVLAARTGRAVNGLALTFVPDKE
jgi:hypothetical protein